MKKKAIMLIGILLIFKTAGAQFLNPVKWSYAAKKHSATEVTLYLKATINEGWHIYSINQKEGGPLKTSFVFQISTDYTLVGSVMEPMPMSKYDDTFGMTVLYFNNTVIFQQKIKLKKPKTMVKGKIEFMSCTDQQCTPPLEVDFSIPIQSNP